MDKYENSECIGRAVFRQTVKIMKRPIDTIGSCISGVNGSGTGSGIESIPNTSPSSLPVFASVPAMVDTFADFAHSKLGMNVPKGCYHAFIVFENAEIGYGENGIKIQPYKPYPYETMISERKTCKTFSEFAEWCIHKAESTFAGRDFMVSGEDMNNCIVFVKRACQFFEIPFPEELQEQLNFLKNGATINPLSGIDLWSTAKKVSKVAVSTYFTTRAVGVIPAAVFGLTAGVYDIAAQSRENRRKRPNEVFNSLRQPSFWDKL